MPNSNWLAKKLCEDFPQFSYKAADICRWSPDEQTIYYIEDNDCQLLHELGHALLGHKDFIQDVEILHIERDAWEKALEIAPNYNVEITDEQIESAMDEYRDWLHARSLCPKCDQTGLQSRQTGQYKCLNCGKAWVANDARQCGLKRRSTN